MWITKAKDVLTKVLHLATEGWMFLRIESLVLPRHSSSSGQLSPWKGSDNWYLKLCRTWKGEALGKICKPRRDQQLWAKGHWMKRCCKTASKVHLLLLLVISVLGAHTQHTLFRIYLFTTNSTPTYLYWKTGKTRSSISLWIDQILLNRLAMEMSALADSARNPRNENHTAMLISLSNWFLPCLNAHRRLRDAAADEADMSRYANTCRGN